MNKTMYKLEVLSVKYVPIIIAGIVLLNSILSYFDIYITWLDYIAGTSLLTLIPMYISSYVFKFCGYHRMFINYIVAHKLVETTDMYIGIPISDLMLLFIYLILAGIFAFITIYWHQKYKNDKGVETSIS